MTTTDDERPPDMHDVQSERFYRFYATCPVCHETHGPFDDDTEVMLEARYCYFSHEETPTPDPDEAEAIGMTDLLVCDEVIGGCGWSAPERLADNAARRYGKCPDCDRYVVTRDRKGAVGE